MSEQAGVEADVLPLKRVGIFGAGTAQGIELMRVSSMHPMFELAFVADEFLSGTAVRERFPGLAINVRGSFVDPDPQLVDSVDLVFCALDDADAALLIPAILKHKPDARIVDLSSWFKPADRDLFERISGKRHPAPQLVERFCYGISDRELAPIAAATCVSVPSALAQSLLIALEPLAREGVLRGRVCASALLGAPEARPMPGTCISPSVSANRPLSHPAALEVLGRLAQVTPNAAPSVEVQLVPVHAPHMQGCYATVFIELSEQLTLGTMDELLKRYYDNALFVRQLGSPPELAGVLGSNRAHFSIRVADQTLVANVALDTLGRGGAQHAIELANIMLRLPEEAGLMFAGMSQ